MKKAIFTLAAAVLFGMSAKAQGRVGGSRLSLGNAVEVNFGKGVAISGKTAAQYSRTVKAKTEKGMNVTTEAAKIAKTEAASTTAIQQDICKK